MMKKLFLLTLLLATINCLYAKKVPGTITFNDGKTENVTLNIPFHGLHKNPLYLKLVKKINYTNSQNKRMTLKPDEVKKITFTYGENKKVTLISVPIPPHYKKRKHFLRVIAEGRLEVIQYAYRVQEYERTQTFIKDGDKPVFKLPRNYKELLTLLSDCPSVCVKIQEDADKEKNESTLKKVFKKSQLRDGPSQSYIIHKIRAYNKECPN